MSLRIKSIELDNFRGYSHLHIQDLEELVVVVGQNAVGKTNIIEAIQLLTSGISFRRSSWADIISWDHEKAFLKLIAEDEKRRIEHVITVKDNERIYEINGKKKQLSSFQGNFPCVLFIPDDLQLIKASSIKRRDAVDSLAVQLSKQYSSLRSNYQQVIRQRNLLIKQGACQEELLESWNESLAIHGSRLCLSRWRLFTRLSEHMKTVYQQIVPGERLDTVYIPSWDRFDEKNRQRGDRVEYIEDEIRIQTDLESIEKKIIEALPTIKEDEIRRGTTLIGPHKDELAFFINGRNARLFGSQGQQRTIVLAMKIAAVKLVQEIKGVEPVLLLDDVMSELDEKHRESLTAFTEKNAQTFITTTDSGYFSKEFLDRAYVLRVPIKGTRYEY